MDRIILAFASEKAHAQITRILGSGGLAPSISCFSGAEFFASLDLAQGVLAGGAPASRLHIQRSAEEERLICRAKAVLMEVNLMSEAEAHRFLQKYSMDTGLRLAETARLILERYTTG